MWKFVRVEDFEDNGNVNKWVVAREREYLMMIHEELVHEYANPQMRAIELIPAHDVEFPASVQMYWVDYVSVYDENESRERIGFAYRDGLTNDAIVAAFVASHA